MNHHLIWRLRNQHRWLEQRILREQRKRQADASVLQALKRRRLRVKDELFLAELGLARQGIRPAMA